MKNLFRAVLLSFFSSVSLSPLYAFDIFSIESPPDENETLTKVYGIDLSTNTKTLLTEKDLGANGAGMNSFVSPSTGELILTGTADSNHHAYDWKSDTWRTITDDIFPGSPLVLQKQSMFANSNVISVGQNSLKLQETSKEMKMWATDSQGRIAPINITNGSKLLINGRDVEQSINNVGALSAALTGLPTVPTETSLACGLGTGTHGGDFAFSGGCASKLNEKLSINYAASMTMPGQDYAGDFEDTFSARAGFVWKLGKAIKPTQISMKEKENFKNKIESLEEKNKQLISRLERLEKFALKEIKSKDLAIYKLK
ncbi:hypothetical protein CU308_00210 [Prochlorococcus marinus str. MU1410]|uniref:YadA-like family protein n=1 Tax=Prochlorococcus marinus TaxID=1219 RepID=UPI001C57E72C|nr:YadA-like family protein [Prochlorococcus marinus]MBW3052264.1 hypothetical protein [Prochlorococcus marinus str. MU1410]